jgi:hypothetical protein
MNALDHCSLAVVGGGWGGVYAAWRLVVDAPERSRLTGSSVCLFDAASRTGGRTYSVNASDGLVVDVGAYRFKNEQRLPAELIRVGLNLSTACYEPSCGKDPMFNVTLYKIIQRESGENAGFGSAMEVMLEQLRGAGARLFLNQRLTAVVDGLNRPTATAAAASATTTNNTTSLSLHFSTTVGARVGKDGTGTRRRGGGEGPGSRVVTADAVVLNMPRNAVLALSNGSVVFESPGERALIGCTTEPTSLFAVKAYVSYADAWWVRHLNLTEGQRQDVNATPGPPIDIRYHDGPLSRGCRPGAPPHTRCYGALQAMYEFSHGPGDLSWYLRFQRAGDGPLGIYPPSSPLVLALHQKLVAMHATALRAVGVDPTTIAPPTEGLLGIWRADAPTRPCPRPVGPTRPSCFGGLSPGAFLARLRQPLASRRLFLTNNDFWWTPVRYDGDWAQESLVSTERILHDHFRTPRPSWLDPAYYDEVVLGGEPADVNPL